jgi:cytochrome d ubiquinol oxidase subunit II
MNDWLPVVFTALMGLSMLLYVVLDGYDLGVGILLRQADDAQKDTMIASIGPFWDANETWLVLGVGLLLVAFPMAHGVILGALYLPVAFMLIGLILRGVAFDFRVKVHDQHKPLWNVAFYVGSLLAALSQGFMLGLYITGLQYNVVGVLFGIVIALCLVAGYMLLGSGWLIMKTEGELRARAIAWGRRSLWFTGIGIVAVSLATPLVSPRIFEKWFSLPNLFFLMPIPLLTGLLFMACLRALLKLGNGSTNKEWVPFVSTIGMFVLAFGGLAFSIFPYLVIDQITLWEAASAPGSLKIMLFGAAITLPVIIAYNIYSYRVFWGKTSELNY